ncbi:MAG: hypothetical protein IJZ48_05895 [Oscillospiraceae bacterium]|nr:hypothetical protein [Oscillospiraceae bacterium]
MRKPVVDYRNLRLKNITSPQYRHLLLMLGWLVYGLLYLLTENLIPVEDCHVVYSPLDDKIPFCEWFVIPYVGWYVLIVISLGYFALYNVENFKCLQTYIMITQAIAMAIYIVWPSVQLLRPNPYPRDNILVDLVRLIQSVDTPTGVCPSLHVGYSLGIASAWLKEKQASKKTKAFVCVFVFFVCISVAFVKQHSVVDIWAAIPMCAVAEILVFRKYYKKKWQARRFASVKSEK